MVTETDLRNPLLESQVISAVMQDPTGGAFEEASGIITADDFSHPRLELIWRTVATLAGEGRPFEPLAVIERLEASGELRRAGGDGFVFQISGESLSPANVGYYADMVRRISVRRRTLAAVRSLASAIEERMDAEPDELQAEAMSALEAIDHPSKKGRRVSMGEIADDEFDALQKPATYVPTPWRELNHYIDGWRPGALYVIGARTGVGKTTFGLNAAAHLSPQGVVPYVSVEMDRHELFARLLANASEVPLQVIHRHTLTETTWPRAAEGLRAVRATRLEVIDGRFEGLESFRRDLLQIRREKGHLAAVVCDYLGLMLGAGAKDRWEKMSDLTTELKALAKEFEVPVIALSQLNRNSASGERAPTLTDLRDGGSVEQDADVVLLLQREEGDHRGDVLKVDVAKNRHGRVGQFELLFEGALGRLSSL